MFHIIFCIKYDWNFGGFLKIHIPFYKHISSISNAKYTQKNHLSIEPSLNFLSAFSVQKTRFLPKKVSNSEFGMRVYRGKIGARSKSIFLDTFLKISPRKINIIKKTELDPRECNELNDTNVKNCSSIWGIFWNLLQKCQKNEKK